jgi:hypothetical protein
MLADACLCGAHKIQFAILIVDYLQRRKPTKLAADGAGLREIRPYRRTVMDYLCNNRKNQPHEKIYGAGAFYDIYTSDRQAVWADRFVPGDSCIVLSEPTPGRIALNWYKFAQEKRGRYGGKPTRVFFGRRFKSENLSRADAMADPLYSKFFATNGRMKRQNLLRVV